MEANDLFLEAMKSRGVGMGIRWPMYLAVCAAGAFSYHKFPVNHQFYDDCSPFY
jgi:hypothetical protein